MTKDEVSKLSDEELDALIAEKVMNWHPGKYATKIWYDANNKYSRRIEYFCPSTDRNASAQVLERIGELQLKPAMCRYIRIILHSSGGMTDWKLMTSTPRQLCEAAYLAWECK